MTNPFRRLLFIGVCFVWSSLSGCSPRDIPSSNSWDPKAAAVYLDQREDWWAGWGGAARGQGTFCISCHTAVPYALSRPALRRALREEAPSPNEVKLVENVRKRVRLWDTIPPFYRDEGHDPKTAESRGTEAVLNALVLANDDSISGHLSHETRTAFNNMWALQQTAGETSGAWSWLNFEQEPFETKDAQYYGAALAAIAVGTAPERYYATAEIQNHLKSLREYFLRAYANQSVINHVVLLWASSKIPGLLNQEQQQSIIREVLGKQQPDGGWKLASLSWRWSGLKLFSLVRIWRRADGTPLQDKSNAYATGLITLVLQQAGIPRESIQLQRGLSWLARNQAREGSWPGYSLNKRRDLTSGTGRFMADASTAYAVLALMENNSTTYAALPVRK